MSHKKLTPSQLALAKKKAKQRAPLLSILTRRLGFSRISQAGADILYTLNTGERFYKVCVNDQNNHQVAFWLSNERGISHEARSAVDFKKPADFLMAFATLSAYYVELPEAAPVHGVSETAAPSPAFDDVARSNSARLEPIKPSADLGDATQTVPLPATPNKPIFNVFDEAAKSPAPVAATKPIRWD